ncbi:MAG TPA: SRPBCC family protein [Gemmatimonadaceae bacterium]|nr:SRPBCC family protein [Gemmatimonadaceae bacterium]
MTRAPAPAAGTIPPVKLGPMPAGRAMTTIDEAVVDAPLKVIFELARDVERWPEHLAHYRFVRFTKRDGRDGGVVEMSANRPFGVLNWPTFWRSEMETIPPGGTRPPAIRFRHIGGITAGMDVVWEFSPQGSETGVRLVHVWNGPPLPLIGSLAARAVIGPVFIHGIASRTLAGLAHAAERIAGTAHH